MVPFCDLPSIRCRIEGQPVSLLICKFSCKILVRVGRNRSKTGIRSGTFYPCNLCTSRLRQVSPTIRFRVPRHIRDPCRHFLGTALPFSFFSWKTYGGESLPNRRLLRAGFLSSLCRLRSRSSCMRDFCCSFSVTSLLVYLLMARPLVHSNTTFVLSLRQM